MPDLFPNERFQPCLLERLCDDETDKREENRTQRVVSFKRYREGVLRDLQWLLNTSAHMPDEDERVDLALYPEALRSVLNFGTRNLSGLSASTLDPADVERRLTEAIELFEPRILRRTLRVTILQDRAITPNVIAFEISAELFADPVPQHLVFKTSIDLETGQCLVGDRPDGPPTPQPL